MGAVCSVRAAREEHMVRGGVSFEELVMASIEAVDAGEPGRGKVLALQAIDRQDNQAEGAWVALSYAERALGDTKAAVDAANQAVRLGPANALTWTVLGDAYAHSTDTHLFEQAITCYDRALALDQDDADSWDSRGVMLMALGRYRESVASFDRALALNPEHEAAWTNRQIALLGADPVRPPLLALAFKIAGERLKGRIAKRDLEPTVLHAFGGNAALDADLVMSFAVIARLMQEVQAPILGMPVSREDVRAIVQFCEVNLVLARHLGDNELIEGCERLYAEIAAAARTG
jgi:tetratricopeptide (TPR) repeat protein